MKKIYRMIALSLSAATLATIGLSACKKKETVTTPTVDPAGIYNGTHVYTATDTDEWLVKNGKTDYKLVLPADYSSTLRIARTEFTDLFKDATGISLTVLTDDQAGSATNGKYISLGDTALLQNSGITVDAETLAADGHRIVTKDDDIYLFGGKDEGTVFSVYTFMRLTFNYETYYYDCMEIENTSEKKLKNYDVTDIPDFKFRAHNSDVTTYESTDYDENMFAWRLGYYGKEATRGYWWMPVHKDASDFTKRGESASTNVTYWFPTDMYEAEHPNWFSNRKASRGQQLCFTARGDEAEYQAMVQTAFEKVIAHLKWYTPDKYPHYKVMTMTHMDNMDYCTCDKCNEVYSYYGDSVASTQVLFMNDLAKLVEAELEKNKEANWYREDFKLLFFAYNHNFQPPARYDANEKKYVPIDDKVIVHDKVIAWFCRDANGQAVFNEDQNSALIAALEGWSAVAKNIYYWNYGGNFRNQMIPLETFQYTTPAMYAYFCNKSDQFWFTEMGSTSTAWHNLKVYLDAKLSWDTSLNVEELTEKWMKAMYKDAAGTMQNLLQSLRSYQQRILIGEYELVSNGDGSPEMLQPEFWPVGTLRGWINQTDKAKEEVARFAVLDPKLYDKICGYIELEAISPLYLMIELHGGKISKEDRAKYLARVDHDIKWLHIEEMPIGKSETLSDWMAKKGV